MKKIIGWDEYKFGDWKKKISELEDITIETQ